MKFSQLFVLSTPAPLRYAVSTDAWLSAHRLQQYASTHAPMTYFFIPPPQIPSPPPPLSVLPLSIAPLPPPCKIPDHFGWEITLARPLLIPPVLLAYTVRFENRVQAFQTENGWVPIGSRAPATRAERQRTGWWGATGEDFEAFSKVKTGAVEWGDNSSILHEQDWMRLRTCYDPWSQPPMRDRVFTPGMLDGIWEGRWLVRSFMAIGPENNLYSWQALQPNSFQTILHAAQTGAHLPVPSLPVDIPLDIETPLQVCI